MRKDDLRSLLIEPHYIEHAEGSCLIKMGKTWVVVTASVEEKVPPFLEGKGEGWVTAEYAMLPRATHSRKRREISLGKPDGRTQEIQRLVGRALRACIDTKILGPRTITLDCDVIQADGGTRMASINGGFVALVLATKWLMRKNKISKSPIVSQVAGVSLGLKKNELYVDLDYALDSTCDVDLNVVLKENGELIEIQGTAERGSFSLEQTQRMVEKAKIVTQDIFKLQNQVLNG